MAQIAPPVIESPMQLTGAPYRLWYNVGQKLGWKVQHPLAAALVSAGNNTVRSQDLTTEQIKALKAMAKEEGVLLRFT